jgi:Zn-dependent protease with chaperone function
LKSGGRFGRALQVEESESRLSFLPQAGVEVEDQRLFALLINVVARIPDTRPPIRSVRTICFRKRSRVKGIVGLTKYSFVEYKVKGANEWRVPDIGRHTVTFYTMLMKQLSDEAVMAVIAHEFAHAWLNEYVRPAQSRRREREADDLAREWGFEHEIHALEAETEPISIIRT